MINARKLLLLGQGASPGAHLLRLFRGENEGIGLDMTRGPSSFHALVRLGGASTFYFADVFLTQPAGGPKLVRGQDGVWSWSPHNLFVNPSAPATQNVTLISGATYTYGVWGSGSLAGSSGASGSAVEGSPVTFVATGTTGTFTVSGSLTRIQINRGHKLTPYRDGGAAPFYGAAFDWDSALQEYHWLVEQNLSFIARWGRDLTNAVWSRTDMAAAKTATGIDGAVNACTTLTAEADGATVLQSITSASAARATWMHVRRRSGAGAVEMTQDGGSTWTSVTVSPEWSQVRIPIQTLTNPVVGVRLAAAGDQIDVDAFMHAPSVSFSGPRSPVFTFGSNLTVLGEVPRFSLETLGLTGPYPISVYYDLVPTATVTGPRSMLTLGNDANEHAEIFNYGQNLIIYSYHGGLAALTPNAGAITVGQRTQASARFGGDNDLAVSLNGAAVATDTNGAAATFPLAVGFGGNPQSGIQASPGQLRIRRLLIALRGVSDNDLRSWRNEAT